MAADGSDAKGALESFTNAFKPDKTGSAIGGAVSGQGKEKPGVSVGCLSALLTHGKFACSA